MHIKYICFLLLLVLASCGSSRSLVNFSNLEVETSRPVENDIVPKIKPRDLLSISVSSPDHKSNVLFNTNKVLSPIYTHTEVKTKEYFMSKEGGIHFPVNLVVSYQNIPEEYFYEMGCNYKPDIVSSFSKPVSKRYQRLVNLKVWPYNLNSYPGAQSTKQTLAVKNIIL